MENLCAFWRIEKVHTRAYHALGKGGCDRLNQTRIAPCLHGEHLEEWDVALSEVIFSLNTSVHTATGFTQHFLMFGDETRIPLELILVIPLLEHTHSADYFRRYQRLSLACDAAGESTLYAQRWAKATYDVGGFHKHFHVPDTVRGRILTIAQSPTRLQSKYSEIHLISKL